MLTLKAAADVTVLVVIQSDGTKATFALSDKPEMTFVDGDCIFEDKEHSVTISRRDIVDFHFESVADAIETVECSDVHTEFIDNNTLRIKGVTESSVRVYDMQGKSVNVKVNESNNSVTVSLQQLPQGVYIVKYPGAAIKTMKK